MAMDQENAETHLNSWMVRWIYLGQRMAMQLQGHLHSQKVPFQSTRIWGDAAQKTL